MPRERSLGENTCLGHLSSPQEVIFAAGYHCQQMQDERVIIKTEPLGQGSENGT